MTRAWWMGSEERAEPNIPIYSDETGWGYLDPSSEKFEGGEVVYTLVPLRPDPEFGYSSRRVRLSPEPTPELAVYGPNDKTGRIRLLSPRPTLEMMLEIINLRGLPLDPAPFSYGPKLTRFSMNEQYRASTREAKYQAARMDGDPLSFARAFRDLVERRRLYGRRSSSEKNVLTRMADELAFEVAATLPEARRVPAAKRWAWGRDFLSRHTGTELFDETTPDT